MEYSQTQLQRSTVSHINAAKYLTSSDSSPPGIRSHTFTGYHTPINQNCPFNFSATFPAVCSTSSRALLKFHL